MRGISHYLLYLLLFSSPWSCNQIWSWLKFAIEPTRGTNPVEGHLILLTWVQTEILFVNAQFKSWIFIGWTIQLNADVLRKKWQIPVFFPLLHILESKYKTPTCKIFGKFTNPTLWLTIFNWSRQKKKNTNMLILPNIHICKHVRRFLKNKTTHKLSLQTISCKIISKQ